MLSSRYSIRFSSLIVAILVGAFVGLPAAHAAPWTYLEKRFQSLSTKVEAQNAKIQSLQATVSALQQADAFQSALISSLEQSVLALETQLAGSCGADETPVCCPAGMIVCAGQCVDPMADGKHCGSCDNACATSQACVAGTCGVTCTSSSQCGPIGDTCSDGLCRCGSGAACTAGATCNDGVCTLCGDGIVGPGEECDDGNTVPGDGCDASCQSDVCTPFSTFAVGVFGTTTCESRCASEGGSCIGIGTDAGALDGKFNDCGSASSGIATFTSPGTCQTVLGGNGCSEFTNCLCSPAFSEFTTFGVGVFGTTTCNSRCIAEGGTCVGIGTDENGQDGMFNDCGSATSGIATMKSPGTCSTVLGGSGCSEFATCRCTAPAPECTGVVFAVGVYGTTSCASRCVSEGGTCVGIGTDDGALDGLFNDCGSATNGVATMKSPGSCSTVLGGSGCSEFTNCLCSFD